MKSFRILQLLMLVMAWTLPSFDALANPITLDDAKQKAQEFFSSGKARRVKGKQTLLLAHTVKAPSSMAANADDEAAIYVFNVSEGNGFVFVSGDDVVVPILGYCDKGNFDVDNIPSNVKAWLDGYAAQISWARSNLKRNLQAAPKKNRSNIDFLLSTTWNQNAPYNDQCIFNGTRCVTGCMPTVLAQVLYYWATTGKDGKTFSCGSKALDAYTTEKNGYYVSALDALNSFDWENMTYGTPTTTESKAAVSQLFRYCGQVIQADFDANGTGGSLGKAVHALKYNFGYNIGMSMVKEENYTASEWDDMVYDQLADGKPVIISGSGNGSHAFICDGYNASDDTYHINWGWGGYCDGWFAMNALNPSYYDYNQNKFAVINIQPFEESTYALLSPDGKTLSFYHDRIKDTRDGTLYEMNEGNYYSDWYNINTITDVYFDSSFANARPTTTAYWFYNQANLKNIVGIENLNTSEVTSMYCMFYGCSALENLDVSHFNTLKVTTMRSMFSGCSALTSLDVSHFNTTNVTEMAQMFYGCSVLKSLDLRSFDFSHVSTASNMMTSCKGLTSLYIPSMVADVGQYGCSGVGTSQSPCVIYAPEGYDFGEGVNTSALYFRWNTGYFFLKGTVLPYAALSDNTLTFYYDDMPWEREETKYRINDSGTPSWYGVRESVSSVKFDDSFAEISPISTYQWFSGMANLAAIEGMENLNTSNTENMERMFFGCTSLSSLDLSLLDMSHVTVATSMLYNCKGLKNLYIPLGMSGFTEFATVCNGIGTSTAPCYIHAPEGFDFGVETTSLYFRWNSGYFYLPGTVVPYAILSNDQLTFYFDDMPWQRGIVPMAMNTTGNPAWYASNTAISGVTFDPSFANARPISTYRWFLGMVNLVGINGLNYLNTSNTTNMSQMFYNCGALTSLDLSHLDMTQATSFSSFITGCKALTQLHIHESMSVLATNACSGIGTADAPCELFAPEGFDFGVDTSGDYFRWKQGYFRLGKVEVLMGDVNGDGFVNITDVVCLTNYVLEKNPDPFIMSAADVNHDGEVNISDVVVLVSTILSGN